MTLSGCWNTRWAERARVNLVRLTHKKVEVEDWYLNKSLGTHVAFGEDKAPDSFERWIAEHLGRFESDAVPESEEETAVKLRKYGIEELLEAYDEEMKTLLEAFQAFGKVPVRIIEALGLDKRSIQELVRKDIQTLKHRYWRCAFEKLDAVKSRLTYRTRQHLLNEMEEFNTLDFNAENIYSLVAWVIQHTNQYTAEQLLDVFDKLTNQDYIRAYKSNVHWTRDDWRSSRDPEYKGKPEKYRLDYRFVIRCWKSWRNAECVIDDFIVICRTLGYYINPGHYFDHEAKGVEQRFYTVNGELVFTVRYFKNENAHIKVNEKLMLRFNVEVARLRHWINSHEDIEHEFDVTPFEAFSLWRKPSLRLIGRSDLPLLGCSCEDSEAA